ncbi:hypothetical protein AYO38_07425, partial [bacterium SCGC AG-212-C10]
VAAIGVARDAPTALLAAHNVPAAQIVRADASAPPLDIARFAVIVDPSRRESGTRRFDPAAFSPPWDVTMAIAQAAPAAVVKASPGIGHEHIPASAEAEFVQLGRSMREAALWSGHTATPGLRRAVLLPAAVELDSTAEECDATTVPVGDYIFDPESCVTRAGLVRHLGRILRAQMLDENVAYLTGAEPSEHPMAATFAVLERLPFSVSRLKETLRRNHWRPVEIRRRAFPIEPDELRGLLGKLDGEPMTVLCTTLGGNKTIIIGRRVRSTGPGQSPDRQ